LGLGHDFRFQICYFKVIKVLFRPDPVDSGVLRLAQRPNRRPGGGWKHSHADGHGIATKCLLRRQTESQRDPVHPWSLAREWGERRRGWQRCGMKWRRNHGVAAKGEDDDDF